jgi:PAS domain S-box-containing protein
VPDLLADPWRDALLESSLDCVIIMDAAGSIVDLNQGTAEAFGVDRAATIGRRVADVFVPPELRERHSASLARYLATGESRILGTRIEVPALHASGRRIPVELAIVRLRGIDPPLFIGHLRKIEGRVRSQRRLRVSAAVHAVLATAEDVDSAIRDTLSALGEALGWMSVQFWRASEDRTALSLRAWWDRPGGIDMTPLRGTTAFASGVGLPGTVLATGEPAWIDRVETAANFPRLASAVSVGIRTAIALPIDVRGGVVGVIEAFSTDEETRDQELLQLLGVLGSQLGHFIEESGARAERDAMLAREQEANRLKDEFLAVVSHELRTPLAPIVGWARLLREQPTSPEQLRVGLQSIERNALLESQLVEDLLDVSRIIAGKLTIAPVPTDALAAILASVDTVRAASAQRRLRLSVEAPAALPAVLADPKRLQQILSNVLSNAIKFTPEGGTIAVTALDADGFLEVSISDSGIGIEPAFLPHVFDRFRQADGRSTRTAGGLGLGLSIVRDLVAAHGGSVAVTSEGPGRGTTVTIRLPVCPIPPAAHPRGSGPDDRS